MLEDRKIALETDFLVERIDPERKVLVSYDEREVPFDLLVTVPLNMGADFVARSGLGDELNYVAVDRRTMQSTAYPDIFAIGDANDLPTSKAGSVAHFSVEVFTENFCEYVEGAAMTERFDGHANCFVESGDGKGAADRLQLRHRAAARRVPVAAARSVHTAAGDRSQSLGQVGVPMDVLALAFARPAATAAEPHVHGRQTST